MIIKDTFGKIEIIKDENTKEPMNNLNYMLNKLQNKNIEIEIEWEGYDRAEGKLFSDSLYYHSFNLPFYHHYTLKVYTNIDISIYAYYNGILLCQKYLRPQDIYNIINIYYVYHKRYFYRPFTCYKFF